MCIVASTNQIIGRTAHYSERNRHRTNAPSFLMCFWEQRSRQGKLGQCLTVSTREEQWSHCYTASFTSLTWSLFCDVVANGVERVLDGFLGVGEEMAEGAVTASPFHTSIRLDAVTSGFPLSFDTTASSGAAGSGVSWRHQFPCVAVFDPLYFLQNLMKKNGKENNSLLLFP